MLKELPADQIRSRSRLLGNAVSICTNATQQEPRQRRHRERLAARRVKVADECVARDRGKHVQFVQRREARLCQRRTECLRHDLIARVAK